MLKTRVVYGSLFLLALIMEGNSSEQLGKLVRVIVQLPTAEASVDGYSVDSQKGYATYYGGRFHGEQTANGEVFDKFSLTAAHPDLPFGTRVRVTSLYNGKAVTVRINDRLPEKRHNIIDLSYKAGRQIGLLVRGIVPVKLEFFDKSPSKIGVKEDS